MLTILAEVIQLTGENFDQHPLKFVKFFAPWCGHCKALAPDWVTLSESDIKIAITEIDCDAHKDVCGKHSVSGFPTLKLFNGETVYDYDGPRQIDAMRTWAEAMLLPALTYKTQQEVDEAVKGQSIYFVVSTDDAVKDEKYFESFKGKVQLHTVKGPRKLTAYRVGEVYELTSFSYAAVDKFISMHKLPFFAELGPDTYATLTSRPVVMFAADKSRHGKLIKELGEAVKELNKNGDAILEKLNFCFIDGGRWKEYLDNTYKISELPAIVGLIKEGDYKTAEFEDTEQYIAFAKALMNKKDEL